MGQGPGGEVVDPRARLLLQVLALGLQGLRVHPRVELQEGPDQGVLGLAGRHDPGPRGELELVQPLAQVALQVDASKALVRAQDLDLLFEQDPQELRLASGVPAGNEGEGPVVARRVRRDGSAPLREPVPQDRVAFGVQRLEVRQARHRLMVNGFPIGQHLARSPTQRRSEGAGLLVEDPGRADQGAPRIGVERAPAVSPLAGVVVPAEAIEGLRDAVPEGLLPRAVAARQERVERLLLRIEQEGVEAAHLVGIDEQLRVKGQHCAPATPRFGLGAGHPVAVHVEQVVVAATVRPAAAVHAGPVEAGRAPQLLLDHAHDALPTVGIHDRVDDHDDVLQQGLDAGVGAGHEVVADRHGGIRAGGLVAVDAVAHPGHRGRFGQQRIGLRRLDPAGIEEPARVLPDLGQPLVVRGRRDDRVDQLAALVRRRVGEHAHPRRALLPAFEAGQDLRVMRELRGVAMPQDRVGRRDRRVIARFGEEGSVVDDVLSVEGADEERGEAGGEQRGSHGRLPYVRAPVPR